MNKAEILVIDDEAPIRKLEIIESNDYKVWLAETGKEGILIAINHPQN
jgi:two-component system KDP operon response regulator KdpE